jgi:hypothetical protein
MIPQSTHGEIIDRILDKGMVISNENLDFCCPDCIQEMNNDYVGIYVLASVETFLVWAEAMGCTDTGAVPALSDTTEQPLGAVAFGNCNCCTHIVASVETEGKFYEAYLGDATNTIPTCSDNFNQCVNTFFTNTAGAELTSSLSEVIDRIFDKGVVEYGSISGSSQLCKISQYLDFFIQKGDISSPKAEVFDRMLDKGFVVSCHNDEIIVASLETWLKLAGDEDYPMADFNRGWASQGQAPAIPNKD